MLSEITGLLNLSIFKYHGMKHKKRYIIFGSIILILVIIRLFLPAIVLHYANKSLANMNGYYGHVNDIDIDLYRGAYQLDSIYINKEDSLSKKQTEFFNAKTIDLSIEWKSLLKGSLVGELEFLSPKLVFTKDKTEIQQVAKDTNDFRKILKDFMPLKINKFEIINGSIHYVDKSASPKVDISLTKARVVATNLRNTTDEKEKLPSDVVAGANIYDGTLSMKMKLNALADDPTFDLSAEIKNANLVKLNDFFKAYGKFDINKGTFGLYTEFAAVDGKFKGYVKPIIKDLDVVGMEDKNDGFFQKAKESIIGVAADIFKNHKKDQLATKIPIEGTFKNPSIDNWEAIWEVLRNAFIEALMPSIDNEINIESAADVPAKPKKEGFFKRLFSFGKKDKEEKKATGLHKYSTSKKK
jgi:hypothetical protein